MALNHKMAEKHEGDVAAWLNGRKSRGSGNQWNDRGDGRQDRYDALYAFSWDCKSTRGQSVSIGRAMWQKLVEDVGGERPLLPLRFYTSDRLDYDLDLAVITMQDLLDLRHAAIGV